MDCLFFLSKWPVGISKIEMYPSSSLFFYGIWFSLLFTYKYSFTRSTKLDSFLSGVESKL
jgi:hypothetical protein